MNDQIASKILVALQGITTELKLIREAQYAALSADAKKELSTKRLESAMKPQSKIAPRA